MKFEWGDVLRLSVEGASHSPEIAVTLKGLPCGVNFDIDRLQAFMSRRKPTINAASTKRSESDIPIIASGVYEGFLNGETLVIEIKNEGQKSSDYDSLKNKPRPAHADYTAYMKYGKDFDLRGGGHLSGRMTVALCAAGGVCLQYLAQRGIAVGAHILSVGNINDVSFDSVNIAPPDLYAPSQNKYAVINADIIPLLNKAFTEAAQNGDSLGGIVECAITGVPAGIGEPIFDSVESVISHLMFSIPAVKGVSFGSGFGAALLKGSENNDAFYTDGQTVKTYTNNHGGILGGITSGMPIIFSAAFKPTPSISIEQKTVDLSEMKNTTIKIEGRHDVCIVPRAVPCVEACAALALTELILKSRKTEE